MSDAVVEAGDDRNKSGDDSGDGLPLAPIEYFLIASDSPDTPIVFRVKMRFTGRFQKALLHQAFDAAVARQPLLTSRVAHRNEKACWVRGTSPQLEWHTLDFDSRELVKVPIEWADLHSRSGLRARAWANDHEFVILLDFHHACCDGQGARQLIGEWLGFYHQLLTVGHITPASLHIEKLKDRATYRIPNPPIGLFEGLRNLYHTVRGKTIRLPALPTSEHIDGRSDRLAEIVLDESETRSIRERLKRARYSVNDAGLTASFLSYGLEFPELMKRRQFITVLHPVDLRSVSDLRVPACNRVGVCFPRRKPWELQDPVRLIQTVHRQMQYVKTRYVGAEFLRGLAMTGQRDGVTDWLQKRGVFVPSLQYTCLGDTTRALHYPLPRKDGVLQFEELRLDHISGTMQMGPFFPLSLALCETSDKIALTLRASAKFLTQSSTEKFLSTYVDQLIKASVIAESHPRK